MGVVFNHPGGTGDFQPIRRRRKPQLPVTPPSGPIACGRVPQAPEATPSTPLLPVTSSLPSGHTVERLVASQPDQPSWATPRKPARTVWKEGSLKPIRLPYTYPCGIALFADYVLNNGMPSIMLRTTAVGKEKSDSLLNSLAGFS